jgi:hypothetical protein
MGTDACLGFCGAELWPLLRGETPVNSFPFLHFASSCFLIASTWLGAVVFGWSYTAFRLCVRAKSPPMRGEQTDATEYSSV